MGFKLFLFVSLCLLYTELRIYWCRFTKFLGKRTCVFELFYHKLSRKLSRFKNILVLSYEISW